MPRRARYGSSSFPWTGDGWTWPLGETARGTGKPRPLAALLLCHDSTRGVVFLLGPGRCARGFLLLGIGRTAPRRGPCSGPLHRLLVGPPGHPPGRASRSLLRPPTEVPQLSSLMHVQCGQRAGVHPCQERQAAWVVVPQPRAHVPFPCRQESQRKGGDLLRHAFEHRLWQRVPPVRHDRFHHWRGPLAQIGSQLANQAGQFRFVRLYPAQRLDEGQLGLRRQVLHDLVLLLDPQSGKLPDGSVLRVDWPGRGPQQEPRGRIAPRGPHQSPSVPPWRRPPTSPAARAGAVCTTARRPPAAHPRSSPAPHRGSHFIAHPSTKSAPPASRGRRGADPPIAGRRSGGVGRKLMEDWRIFGAEVT
jgi:hypothetical protein